MPRDRMTGSPSRGVLTIGRDPASRSSNKSSSSSTSFDVIFPASWIISSSCSCGNDTAAEKGAGRTSNGSRDEEATARTFGGGCMCSLVGDCFLNRLLNRVCQDGVCAMGVDTALSDCCGGGCDTLAAQLICVTGSGAGGDGGFPGGSFTTAFSRGKLTIGCM